MVSLDQISLSQARAEGTRVTGAQSRVAQAQCRVVQGKIGLVQGAVVQV